MSKNLVFFEGIFIISEQFSAPGQNLSAFFPLRLDEKNDLSWFFACRIFFLRFGLKIVTFSV